MKKKLFKVLMLTMVFTAMLSISALAEEGGQREEVVDHLNAAETYLTSSVQEYITAEGDYSFDSTHSIHVKDVFYAEYAWTEGVYGWFNEAYTYNITIESNDVHCDDLKLLEFDYTENTHYEKYRIYCTKTSGYNFSEYVVYMEVRAMVDEWGEVYVWLKFVNS